MWNNNCVHCVTLCLSLIQTCRHVEMVGFGLKHGCEIVIMNVMWFVVV